MYLFRRMVISRITVQFWSTLNSYPDCIKEYPMNTKASLYKYHSQFANSRRKTNVLDLILTVISKGFCFQSINLQSMEPNPAILINSNALFKSSLKFDPTTAASLRGGSFFVEGKLWCFPPFSELRFAPTCLIFTSYLVPLGQNETRGVGDKVDANLPLCETSPSKFRTTILSPNLSKRLLWHPSHQGDPHISEHNLIQNANFHNQVFYLSPLLTFGIIE